MKNASIFKIITIYHPPNQVKRKNAMHMLCLFGICIIPIGNLFLLYYILRQWLFCNVTHTIHHQEVTYITTSLRK